MKLILCHAKSLEPFEMIDIPFRTGLVRHLFIHDLNPPFAYCFQSDDPSLSNTSIFDPFSKILTTHRSWGVDEPYRPFGLVLENSFLFDWGNDQKPNYPKEELVIYEMHVRGFTKTAALNQPESQGTFLGLIEKIPYLQDLGINAVELLPIQEFDEMECKFPSQEGQRNFQYWGYSTVNFFTPMNRYASAKNGSGDCINEFKEMVKALHQAKIEVILDIVLNHTAEGDENGPKLSFKLLAPHTYYLFKEGTLANYTGCGNTLNCNHPIVIEFILSVLRHWVFEFHVDGFRFDLASIFYRGMDGNPLATPPLVQAITKDPLLAGTKLIAEPWDAGGLYQVGSFFKESTRWGEWNGKYRDCVRKFLKGDLGLKSEFATRLSGSEDLFGHDKRLPRNSINFITSHDGFTLRDLVSYNEKHNQNNGEDNRDGNNQNDSWNCGAEGATSDPDIIALRQRQMRNFHLALMVSQGVPMLHMGDEYGHTKKGNNNTWCQDNELNWFLWDELAKEQAFHRFYRGLIHFRKSHPLLHKKRFLHKGDIEWHGKTPFMPNWENDDNFIAFTLIDKEMGNDLYIAFNAGQETVEVKLPERKKGDWHWIVNTALPPPLDLQIDRQESGKTGGKLRMKGYSGLLLKAY